MKNDQKKKAMREIVKYEELRKIKFYHERDTKSHEKLHSEK